LTRFSRLPTIPPTSIIGSNRWLPLIQGVVSLALGGFFVARKAS